MATVNTSVSSSAGFIPYEAALSQDLDWAMSDASLYFDEKGRVQDTLRNIVKRLEELGIPYAVVGGLALFAHGFRRFTEDVDILVTRESAERIMAELEGRGYTRLFSTSKNIRDAETGVRIEFLISGGYPGLGKPQPVSFPDPKDCAVTLKGRKYVSLEKLIELKLASGMAPHRDHDLVDVKRTIEALDLPLEFAERLDPSVRTAFRERWNAAHSVQTRFALLWSVPDMPAAPDSLDDLVRRFGAGHPELVAMKNAGVQLDAALSNSRRALLFTTDPKIAAQFGMHPESEMLI